MKDIYAKILPKISNYSVGYLLAYDSRIALAIKSKALKGWIVNSVIMNIGGAKIESFMQYTNLTHEEIVADFKAVTIDDAFHIVGNKSITIENRVNKIRSLVFP